MLISWKVTFLAFLKKQSGLQMSCSQPTSRIRYSSLMFSGRRRRGSLQLCAKKMSATYVCNKWKLVSLCPVFGTLLMFLDRWRRGFVQLYATQISTADVCNKWNLVSLRPGSRTLWALQAQNVLGQVEAWVPPNQPTSRMRGFTNILG